jgi:hypothetical protein
MTKTQGQPEIKRANLSGSIRRLNVVTLHKRASARPKQNTIPRHETMDFFALFDGKGAIGPPRRPSVMSSKARRKIA